MRKAGLGFRVKSGWSAAVVMSGPSSSPHVVLSRRIDLSDPARPETRQPYHAADESKGELETDENRLEERERAVRIATARSVGGLLAESRERGWMPQRAGLVAGSLIDPSTISHAHIRAHAMDGRLFRVVLEEVVTANELSCFVLAEKTAFEAARKVLRRPEESLKRALTTLGRRIGGPWRGEEKLAALAAWMAISGRATGSRPTDALTSP